MYLPIPRLCNTGNGDGEDDGKGSFGGTCGAFKCDGDAILCAIALKQHETDCELRDTNNETHQIYEAEKNREGAVTGELAGNTTVDVAEHLSAGDDFIGGGSYLTDKSISFPRFTQAQQPTMLYLVTGANGAGKTLNTLKWVRERSVSESRPVCHNGRFEPVPGGELAQWKKIDIKNWQDEPDGTIFLVDECHNDFPVRAASSPPPEYVRMLAEHRRRGMDFYLVTQHPQNIDNFVRRLIGDPGWHRHLKRVFGANLVSCLQWPAVNANCEKHGSGKTAEVSTVAFPKEVFAWYQSASLHTTKRRMPKAVWVILLGLVIVPTLFWFVFAHFKSMGERGNAMPDATSSAASHSTGNKNQPMSTQDYIASFQPRIPGFAHTAPRYDEVTKPVTAPYPSACLTMGPRCECYSQQGTKMDTPTDICALIVRRGYFVDWQTERDARKRRDERRRAEKAQSGPILAGGRATAAALP